MFTKLPAVEININEQGTFSIVWTTTWALLPGFTIETDKNRMSALTCAGVAVTLGRIGGMVAVRVAVRVGVALNFDFGVAVVLPDADTGLPDVALGNITRSVVGEGRAVGLSVGDGRRVNVGWGESVAVSVGAACAIGTRKSNTSSMMRMVLNTSARQTTSTAMTSH